MSNNRIVIIMAVALMLTFGIRHDAGAQENERTRPANGRVNGELSINFDNAPILEVIDIMSRVTDKNFIIDPIVKGNVTVVAPKRVPKEEAYGVFESILELNGFSLVPVGDIIKVVPSKSATQRSIPVRPGRKPEDVDKGDQIVTQLIPIEHSEAQAIVSILSPLISRDANITAYANTNTIILTEVSSNINRLLKIVQEIDVPGFEESITIIPLVNAQADMLAQQILQALEPGPSASPRTAAASRTRRRQTPAQPVIGAPASQMKIIPDQRTNSLIIVANELDTEQIRFLIQELDKTTPIEANNIHVYRLQNALAEEIAAVLTSLAATTAPASAPGGGAATSGIRTFYKEIAIVADKTTNCLIITATPQDFAVISNVIEQLDVMRPQVLVETLIAEVSLDFSRDLGIRWQAGATGEDGIGFGAVNETAGGSVVGSILGGETSADALPAITNPLNLIPGATPGGLSLGYLNMNGDVLRGFVELHASEGNSDFNVLSAPHILTLDNEKATINISDNVPFITQRLAEVVTAGASTTNETFEYRDVGIILEITPHISPDRMVRLEILQKVNDVSQITSGSSSGAHSEKKREAETTLMVKDRHTLVLGGLMKDIEDVVENKVPFLGDIPILGWLFKSKSTGIKKLNLLIFITPSIVATVAEANELTVEKGKETGEKLADQLERYPTLKRSKTFDQEAESIDDLEAELLEAGPK